MSRGKLKPQIFQFWHKKAKISQRTTGHVLKRGDGLQRLLEWILGIRDFPNIGADLSRSESEAYPRAPWLQFKQCSIRFRICHNFRQIYDNLMMMRFMNNVSLLGLLSYHVMNTSVLDVDNDGIHSWVIYPHAIRTGPNC